MATETGAAPDAARASAIPPRVLVGTSGYSYDDWVGPVYPQGTSRRDFLSLYAREFPVVELNFSYYQQPNPRTLERMVAGTSSSFTFALKAHRSMTHEIGESWENDIAEFRAGIQPMVDAGRLAAVLLQFPYSFAYTPESRSRLASLCGKLEGLPLAVEFRKSEWLREQVFEGLRRRGVSLVSVDEPDLPKLLPPSTETTGRFGYVRFHGRNKAAWWTGDNASRYDYLYASEELEEWVQRIRLILLNVPVLLLFFNNHWRGNAAQNAREMRRLLQQHGLM
ncbi:MAG: DUF72 domain-containing protein [Spirochaetia bacterium]|jgi:uncharacterized protein YecE (DUF72 family)